MQFVLFIGVVIALLLLTFVTLAHTNLLFTKKTERFVDTIKAVDMGLHSALKTNMRLSDSTRIALPSENQIQVTAFRDYWGILEKYTAVGTFKKNRFVKSVLVGHKNSTELPALYLQDNQRPMIIVGKAKITGEAYLPKQGIRPGNISGHSFYGTSLVSGRQRESDTQLPKLNPEFRQWAQQLAKNNMGMRTFENIDFSPNMVAQNSFQERTSVIRGSELVLSGVTLQGNIVVNASRRIVVDPSSNLKDVVLIAPEIRIRNGVSGSFQAIATRRIEVGENCQLAYPSALVVHNTTVLDLPRNQQEPNIAIGANSIIKGYMIYLSGTEKNQSFTPQIKIASGADFWGEIYCEQGLELKGNVFGSVNTAGFLALESGSIYQNHLFNGTINSATLPIQYAGLPIIKNNASKTIAKWLY